MNHGLDLYAHGLDAALGYDAPRVHNNKPFWISQAVGATLIGATGLKTSLKRSREDDFDLREATGLDIGDQLSKSRKKLRGSRLTVSNPTENPTMGLLTYQRQTASSRGQNRRRVRRLARAKRRSGLKGSSNSLITNISSIVLPASADETTIREGYGTTTIYTPSLAQVVYEASRVQAQATGSAAVVSGSYSMSIPKQRWQFSWTPDWVNHTTSIIAAKVTVHKFVLSKKLPINDVLATPAGSNAKPDINYYWSENYFTTNPAPTTGANGLPFDYTAGVISRCAATTNATSTFTADEWRASRTDPVTIFESPAAMGKLRHKWSKQLYIPYGQSMQMTCGHGPININYNDLEINRPERYLAKTASTDGDGWVTPFLPKGWPVFVIRVQAHRASDTYSIAQFFKADAIDVQHRLYYRLPNFPGRMLSINGVTYNSDGLVPRSTNVRGVATGRVKADAYTGLNI